MNNHFFFFLSHGFRQLEASCKNLPLEFQRHKLLPELNHIISMNMGKPSLTRKNDFPVFFSSRFSCIFYPFIMFDTSHTAGSRVIRPFLIIASHLSDDEYKTQIVPTLVKLFSQTDRTIRLSLLEFLESYIAKLPQKILNDTLFHHIVCERFFFCRKSQQG